MASARIISTHHMGPTLLNEDESHQRAAQVHFIDTVLVGGNKRGNVSNVSSNNNNASAQSGFRTKGTRN